MLPRASFVGGATPVERSAAAGALWVKRDDLAALPLGGNKVRALEFLLGLVQPGDEVVTVGGVGSTHALATALYASTLGARTTVFRWRQEMNDAARQVDARLRDAAAVHDSRTPVASYARALAARIRRRVRWIPAGGTTPLGILGHVDAALELVGQVAAGALPHPRRVVLPLGSGGTAAGLLLGFALARWDTEVVGVQVVPRLIANAGHVRRLVWSTRRFIERMAGIPVHATRLPRFVIARAQYGGAYGRETADGRAAAERFRTAHPDAMLDATYSAKACAAALTRCDGEPTLLWLTFDGRWITRPPRHA